MHETLKNLSPKLLWLRLNSGEYVSIPARGSRPVDKARLKRNAAFDKLCKRGVIAVVEKRQAEKAPEEDKKESAKTKTEETQETAAIDKGESTPEETKEKESDDLPVTTKKPQSRTKKTSTLKGIIK